MGAPQSFRSAFNGFHRQDVVNYLEYLNNKHNTQIGELTSELEFLRSKLANIQTNEELEQELEALRQERSALLERCQVLEESAASDASGQKEAALPEMAIPLSYEQQELEAYRRAERAERVANERAELIYHRANCVLDEACAQVDTLTGNIGTMSDEVLVKLQQLQQAVTQSKQTLKEAASILQSLRPEDK